MTKAIVSVPAPALRFKLGRTVWGSGLSESTTGFLFVSFVYLNCKDMGTTAHGYGKATHGASIKPHRAHAGKQRCPAEHGLWGKAVAARCPRFDRLSVSVDGIPRTC